VSGKARRQRHRRAQRPPPGRQLCAYDYDITKRSEAERTLPGWRAEDPLTGLPNRRVFSASLDRVIEQRRATDDASEKVKDFAVLFLDLDRFKVINDTLGHRSAIFCCRKLPSA